MTIQKSSQRVNSNSGIALSESILNHLTALKAFDSATSLSKHALACRKHSNLNIVRSNILLGIMGKTSYCDISRHANDSLFTHILNGAAPSEETYRQRLEKISTTENFADIIDRANLQLLGNMAEEDYGLVQSPACSAKYLPVDFDVSVLVNDDCKKELVSRTYQNVDGYAPIFSTIGTNGFQLANELRAGSQHSQKDFCGFLKRAVGMAKELSSCELLLRMDSAHDASETISACFELDDALTAEPKTRKIASGIRFIVKRNLRSASREPFIEAAMCNSTLPPRIYRNDKKRSTVTIWQGCMHHIRPSGLENRPVYCVYEVVETKFDDELFPQYEVSAWWTNMYEQPETVIELYHEHAVHEQFHSELKSDMGVERLSSGKFLANKLILALATISFNILRIIGLEALKVKPDGTVARMRLRTVLQRLIYVGGIFGNHGGRQILRLGCENNLADLFIDVHKRLSAA